jgi:hypothetical protein
MDQSQENQLTPGQGLPAPVCFPAPKFFAGSFCVEETVQGGTGETPDDAVADYFGNYADDEIDYWSKSPRLCDAQKMKDRDYTPEARRLFLSGIARCETAEQARHELDCIIDLIPDGHPLKVELLQKLKERIDDIGILEHNTEGQATRHEN